MKSISIGITALNENQNILYLIESIVNQSIYSDISQIYIIDDGSSDGMSKTIDSINNSKIKLFIKHKRLGKSKRLMNLFEYASEDILILIDADVIIPDENSLSKLVMPLLSESVSLSSGHPIKTSTNTLFDQAMNASMFLQDYIKESINRGDNVYSCHGRLVALNRKIYKSINIQPTIVGNDAYLYFFNRLHGDGYSYVNNAKVLFKMPQNFDDFKRQSNRFGNSRQELIDQFDILAESEYKVPLDIKISASLKLLLKHPLAFFTYGIVVLRTKMSRKVQVKATWDETETTKNIIK